MEFVDGVKVYYPLTSIESLMKKPINRDVKIVLDTLIYCLYSAVQTTPIYSRRMKFIAVQVSKIKFGKSYSAVQYNQVKRSIRQ